MASVYQPPNEYPIVRAIIINQLKVGISFSLIVLLIMSSQKELVKVTFTTTSSTQISAKGHRQIVG